MISEAADIWLPLWLSLRVAGVATLVSLLVGLPVAWRLGLGRPFRARVLVETLLALPLVLPPTVVGYGLLLLLGRSTSWGRWVQDTLHIEVVFTLTGATIAAFVMACPLLIRTSQAAFASVDRDLLEAARTLGAKEGAIFLYVVLPLAFRGVFAGVTLCFARALGEFGATLMVAGNTPGETQTLPIALYEAASTDDTARALLCAGLLIAVSWATLLVSGAWSGRIARSRAELP